MNFCGFVSGICTGDGEKAHHLMYTLTSVGLNMTPKTVVLLSTIGDDASSDAKLAYVAGKCYIFVMEEVGYQGNVSSSASRRADQEGLEGGFKFKGDYENPDLFHLGNNKYRHTVAT
ncbi:hypothetical protein O3P69_006448 [Scylla paramamosain]|uniref:Uncharacterized protein n=1 Tax=Scylla paramamosain TaxID=85552 RepID=A0AAW0U2G0_SCYPA